MCELAENNAVVWNMQLSVKILYISTFKKWNWQQLLNTSKSFCALVTYFSSHLESDQSTQITVDQMTARNVKGVVPVD